MADPRFLISARSVDPRPARRDDAGWGVPVPVPTVWRLLGANNRELGRSATPYVDARACRAGVTLLRRQLAQLTPVVWSDPRGRWLWRLDLDGRPVAVAARSYLRQRESHYNLELFLASVPVAKLADTPPVARAAADRAACAAAANPRRDVGPDVPPGSVASEAV